MKFHILTKDEIDDRVMTNLHARESEIWEYGHNVRLFEMAIAAERERQPANDEDAANQAEYIDKYTAMIPEQLREMARVAAVHASLLAHFADKPERFEAAKERFSAIDD